MSRRVDTLIEKLESIIEPVCLAHQVELVEVRHVPQKAMAILRITIDRPRSDGKEGSDITLEDCTAVSRDVSAALDVHEDEIPGTYHLEVSSPGLERPLVKVRDFERYVGREIKVRTLAPVPFGGGNRRKFQGVLRGVVISEEDGEGDGASSDEFVEMTVEGRDVRVPYDVISQANLVYRF